MATDTFKKRTAVVSYADASEYTRLTRLNEDATHSALKIELAKLVQITEKHGGRPLGFAGDSLLAEYATIMSALSSALDFQNREASEDEINLKFRIGINFGDVIDDQGTIYGDGVNLAERLHRLAGPGEICVSEALYRAVEPICPWHFEPIGMRSVRHIDAPISAYLVTREAPKARQGPGGHADNQVEYIAVLCGRIIDFSAFVKSLGLEETTRLTDRLISSFEQIVRHYGGVPQPPSGDRINALFGTPRCFGNDIERAVRAGYAFLQEPACREVRLEGRDLVRMGVDCGPAVIARGMGGERRVVGPPEVNANAIADASDRAGIWLSRLVRGALPRTFSCTERGQISSSDQCRPIWQLERIERTSAKPPAFVGRGRELRLLHHLMVDCLERRCGAIVHVHGRAGIGKSSFLEQAIESAKELGFVCHVGEVQDFGTIKGQEAVRAILLRLLGRDESELTGTSHPPADLIGECAVEPEHHATLYGILGLPLPDGAANPQGPMDEALARARERDFLRNLFYWSTASDPLLIAIEDLHWAGRTALNFIDLVGELVDELPIVLIRTSRTPRETKTDLPIVDVQLTPLAVSESEQLAQSWLEASKVEARWRDEMVRGCVERAGGNPLFLINLMRHQADGAGPSDVPPTIMGIIRHRLSELTPEEIAILQAASVAGHNSRTELIYHVLGTDKADLLTLIEKQILRKSGERIAFDHSLSQETVYTSMLTSHREALHRRAADWFADRDKEFQAEHLSSANDPGAAQVFLEAAQLEAAQSRVNRAIALARRGLAQLPAHESEARFELTHMLGAMQALAGDFGQSNTNLEAALALARRPEDTAAVQIELAANVANADRYDDALDLLDKAVGAAEPHNKHKELANAYCQKGNVFFALGRIDECQDAHSTALQQAEFCGEPEALAKAFGGLGDAEYARGRMRRGREYFMKCVEVAERNDSAVIKCANEHMIPTCGHYFLNLDGMLNECEVALEAAKSKSHLRAQLCCCSVMSVIQFDRGDYEAVLQILDKAEELATALQMERFRPLNLTYMAKVLRIEGKRAKARDLIREALDISRLTGMNYNGPRILAELALLADDADERLSLLKEGTEILKAGCIGSGHLWFHRDAIDAALEIGDPVRAQQHIDALSDYAKDDELTWAQIICKRGRAHVQFAESGCSGENKIEALKETRLAAEQSGFRELARVIDVDLAGS